jgi:hypothetical protein
MVLNNLFYITAKVRRTVVFVVFLVQDMMDISVSFVTADVKTHFVQGEGRLGHSRQGSENERENVFLPRTSRFVRTYAWAFYRSSRRLHSNTLLRYIRWIGPGIV